MSLSGKIGIVRPYGDTTGDGRVQLSFTLPVPFGDESERARAEGAALQLAAKMGMDPAMVVHAKGMGPDFTFFIVYGRVSHVVDLSAVTIAEREFPVLPAAEVNLRIRSALGRKLVVVGACIGTDAHTVGIDAILNVKGHAGEKGLEYYREIRVVNMGSQVGVADLVARAAAEHADAVLVSQVVTQRDAHLTNTREMAAAFHAAFVPETRRPEDPESLSDRRAWSGRCWWRAARGSTRARRMTSASTRSSAAAPRRARWPATWCTRSPRQGVRGDGVPPGRRKEAA